MVFQLTSVSNQVSALTGEDGVEFWDARLSVWAMRPHVLLPKGPPCC